MSFFKKWTAFKVSKNEEVGRFNYPEVLVLIISVTLILYYYEFSPAAIALFMVIGLPSLMIGFYSYRRPPSFWISNIVVILISVLIGVMQFCGVIALSLALWVGIRVISSEPENRLPLIAVSIVSALMFYYVSITLLGGTEIDCGTSLLSPAILLVSVMAMLWQFWVVYHKYISYEQTAKEATGRISTMVSVVNKLTRFIPSQIWKPIVQHNTVVMVSNKRVKLSIMFSDIVGFTELSETISADNLADVLNTYIHCMTVIADKHNAVIDKFIGDGMVCFFGDPESRGAREDALACVAMAIDMRREIRSLKHKWRLMGFDGLDVRIGINTDYCHVGNFGSQNRLSYTLIGKAANLASRLESVAGTGEIFISQRTYDYISHDYDCEYAGSYQLKGFHEDIGAWKVLDPDTHKGHLSKWVDHTLPGFNLHLNFKDMQNYDYPEIKNQLTLALERMEKEQKAMNAKLTLNDK